MRGVENIILLPSWRGFSEGPRVLVLWGGPRRLLLFLLLLVACVKSLMIGGLRLVAIVGGDKIELACLDKGIRNFAPDRSLIAILNGWRLNIEHEGIILVGGGSWLSLRVTVVHLKSERNVSLSGSVHKRRLRVALNVSLESVPHHVTTSSAVSLLLVLTSCDVACTFVRHALVELRREAGFDWEELGVPR